MKYTKTDPHASRINVGITYRDGRWVATTFGVWAEGEGDTPAEALAELARVEGFTDDVLAWLQHVDTARAATDEKRAQLNEIVARHEAEKRREQGRAEIAQLNETFAKPLIIRTGLPPASDRPGAPDAV